MKFKKFALAVVLAAGVASSATAKDGFFVGAVGGYDLSSKIISESKNIWQFTYGEKQLDSSKDSAFNFGLRGGYDLGFHRFYGGYSYGFGASIKDSWVEGPYNYMDQNGNEAVIKNSYNNKFSWDAHKIVAGYESRVPVFQGLKAVVGANVGVQFLKFKTKYAKTTQILSGSADVEDYSYTNKCKATNFLFGVNLGVAYDITPSQAVDFGVRYEKGVMAKVKFSSDDPENDGDMGGTKFGSENIGLYVGYSFKF